MKLVILFIVLSFWIYFHLLIVILWLLTHQFRFALLIIFSLRPNMTAAANLGRPWNILSLAHIGENSFKMSSSQRVPLIRNWLILCGSLFSFLASFQQNSYEFSFYITSYKIGKGKHNWGVRRAIISVRTNNISKFKYINIIKLYCLW